MATSSVKLISNPLFMKTIRKRLNTIVKNTAKEVRDEIRRDISIKFPPSSSPGNPPHMRSGETYRSIKAKKIKDAEWAVIAEKQSSGRENLAIWLELGTGSHRKPYPSGSSGSITGEYSHPGPGKTGIQARPFMLNALMKVGDRGIRKSILARR